MKKKIGALLFSILLSFSYPLSVFSMGFNDNIKKSINIIDNNKASLSIEGKLSDRYYSDEPGYDEIDKEHEWEVIPEHKGGIIHTNVIEYPVWDAYNQKTIYKYGKLSHFFCPVCNEDLSILQEKGIIQGVTIHENYNGCTNYGSVSRFVYADYTYPVISYKCKKCGSIKDIVLNDSQLGLYNNYQIQHNKTPIYCISGHCKTYEEEEKDEEYVSYEDLEAQVMADKSLSDTDKSDMCLIFSGFKDEKGNIKVSTLIDPNAGWFEPFSVERHQSYIDAIRKKGGVITPSDTEATTSSNKEETTTSADKNKTTEKSSTENKEVTVVKSTETTVTTERKIKKGDVLKTKKATYTVLSGSSLSYDSPAASLKTVTVPDTIKINGKSYKVTSIKTGAFKNNKKVTRITIGKNVNSIGKKTFYGCTSLKTIKFKGKNIKSIGSYAFKNCKKLTGISIPGNKLTSTGTGVFQNCTSLKKVTLNSTKLKSIGKSLFYGCKNLKSITIKSKKVKFGQKCFKNISKKAVFKVPKNKVKSYRKSIIKTGKAPGKIKVKKL